MVLSFAFKALPAGSPFLPDVSRRSRDSRRHLYHVGGGYFRYGSLGGAVLFPMNIGHCWCVRFLSADRAWWRLVGRC